MDERVVDRAEPGLARHSEGASGREVCEGGGPWGNHGFPQVFFGPELELQVDSYLAVVSWLRRRSRRPRTLASTRSEPAWRTMPPIRSGSTVRVASTGRPDACSIFARICCASSSDSS